MAWRKIAERMAGLAVLGVLPALGGCAGFFQCEGKTSCGSDSSSSTSNIVFASNSSVGTTYISAWTLASGTLTSVSGSPFLLNFVPTAMVVTRSNSYLYVAAPTGSIYSYQLSSAGVPSNGTVQATTSSVEASMDVSPDGKWLLVVDNSTSATPQVRAYSIGSSGVLTITATVSLQNKTGFADVPKMVKVSPDSAYVAVAMGSGGTMLLKFDNSAGTFGSYQSVSALAATDSDNAVAFDSDDNLYIAKSTLVSGATQAYVASCAKGSCQFTPTYDTATAVGSDPEAMAFSSDYKYLYVGNKGDSTISTFSQASGTLTSASTVNTTGPTSISSMTTDKTGDYIIAAGYDASSGVQVFSIGTGGLLAVQPTTGATGTTTSTPSILAATHS